jgi:phosphoenolpyruvate-protein kinase (PTS system EI component)
VEDIKVIDISRTEQTGISIRENEIIKKTGTPISGGIGDGLAWVVIKSVRRNKKKAIISPKYHVREEGKIRHAIQLLSFVIESSIQQVTVRAGEPQAQIFVALKEILHDPSIMKKIVSSIITKNFSAYAAVQEVFGNIRDDLGKRSIFQPGEIVKDLIELEQGLLDALINPISLFKDPKGDCEKDKPGRIILCKYLTPRLVLESRGRQIKGIVAEFGGGNSHAAILCRALGIPTVSDVAAVCVKRFQSAAVAINGSTGEVVLSMTFDEIRKCLHEDIVPIQGTAPQIGPVHLRVFANINLSEHAWQAISSGASGVGLYRTELEFLAAGKFLTEEEQFVKYRILMMAMMGMPVVIRLLDVSYDKILPILETIGHEVDPTLTGADFLEAYPEILKIQARAIARVGDLGDVKILYPMVKCAGQFDKLRDIVVKTIKEEGAPHLQHGAMFEVPSACDEADEIFKVADFGSIGTNDLLKHLFKINRETGSASSMNKNAQNPLLWEYISMVAASAIKANKPLTICGEMATHSHFIQRFLSLGIHSISVDFNQVKRIRKLFGNVENQQV